MIEYQKRVLSNGLEIVIHEDLSTPLVAVNLLYKVGSKDEDESRTGFAHLFEHLMFGGSKNAPDFDSPIQKAGGENNAFTNSDITNFYITIPAQNLETALWLESDRMSSLTLDSNSLEVQRKVVVEEFKETCLNKPYGDLWHHLSSQAYKVHPYKWPTIGKDISHIEEASLDDVSAFLKTYYVPNNAVLVLSGKISPEKGFDLCEKWFGDIPRGKEINRIIPQEPLQTESRALKIEKAVPSNALFLSFPMVAKGDPEFYACDMLSDVLGNGRSSRLYKNLYKQKKYFSKIDSYITDTMDPGLLIVEGRTAEKISTEKALDSIWEEIELLKTDSVPETELKKIKNVIFSTLEFSEINILNKAMNLAYYTSQGSTGLINKQMGKYNAVTADDLKRNAEKVFRKANSNTLVYGPN